MPSQTQTTEEKIVLLQYEKTWQRIMREEKLSMVEAMKRAQDQFPQLYQQFLNACPRGSV